MAQVLQLVGQHERIVRRSGDDSNQVHIDGLALIAMRQDGARIGVEVADVAPDGPAEVGVEDHDPIVAVHARARRRAERAGHGRPDVVLERGDRRSEVVWLAVVAILEVVVRMRGDRCENRRERSVSWLFVRVQCDHQHVELGYIAYRWLRQVDRHRKSGPTFEATGEVDEIAGARSVGARRSGARRSARKSSRGAVAVSAVRAGGDDSDHQKEKSRPDEIEAARGS